MTHTTFKSWTQKMPPAVIIPTAIIVGLLFGLFRKTEDE